MKRYRRVKPEPPGPAASASRADERSGLWKSFEER